MLQHLHLFHRCSSSNKMLMPRILVRRGAATSTTRNNSSSSASVAASTHSNNSGANNASSIGPTYFSPQIITLDDGRQFAAFLDPRKHPKLKPHIVKRRLRQMRTYVGQEKNIRHSPWKLNLVCQFVAGLPLQEALTQLEFTKKWAAPLVQRVLKRTSNLADIRHGLQPSQLEVAECKRKL